MKNTGMQATILYTNYIQKLDKWTTNIIVFVELRLLITLRGRFLPKASL